MEGTPTAGYHQPVLVEALVSAVATVPDGIYVDGTLGDGGHTLALLRRLDRRGRVVALDLDVD